MSTKVAVIGSRDYANQAQVRAYVRTLPKDTLLVSGGAIGVDSWAVDEAHKCGLATPIVIKPDYSGKAAWERKRAPLERNLLIVAEATRVVGFWSGTASSRGTVHALHHAIKLGKLIEAYGEDGSNWDLKHFK